MQGRLVSSQEIICLHNFLRVCRALSERLLFPEVSATGTDDCKYVRRRWGAKAADAKTFRAALGAFHVDEAGDWEQNGSVRGEIVGCIQGNRAKPQGAAVE